MFSKHTVSLHVCLHEEVTTSDYIAARNVRLSRDAEVYSYTMLTFISTPGHSGHERGHTQTFAGGGGPHNILTTTFFFRDPTKLIIAPHRAPGPGGKEEENA